jgi:hypothetical protein
MAIDSNNIVQTDRLHIAIQHAVAEAKIVRAVMVRLGGRGAYDMRVAPAYRIDWSNGVSMVAEDQWCGGDVEGECYRAHITAKPITWRSLDGTWHTDAEVSKRIAGLATWLQDRINAAIASAPRVIEATWSDAGQCYDVLGPTGNPKWTSADGDNWRDVADGGEPGDGFGDYSIALAGGPRNGVIVG